jgi:hypothetical protein
MKISDLVYKEIEDFKKDATVRGKESFNQYHNIRRINAYINNQFLERNDGIFWNIATTRIPHFSKNIDLDTKDFYPYAEGDNSFVPNWILKMKFYAWTRKNKFAITLNDLFDGISTYGSVVWKKCYDEDGKAYLEEVNLENLYFKQTAKCIRDVPVVELHPNIDETYLRGKEDIWENVDKIIKAGKKGKEQEIVTYEIWERWGEYMDDNHEVTYRHVIGYGKGDDQIIAVNDEVNPKKNPYRDFHVGKYQGTWQRIGVVERLYPLQVRMNTLVNQNAQTTAIASLLLLKTNESGTNYNVLDQAISGQVIKTSDLEQIQLTNPGLSQFINEMRVIEVQADKLCNTPEIVTGSNLPSGTPFRGMALMSTAAKSTFEIIRQNLGESIADILLKDILPDTVKDWNREEYVDIADNEKDVEVYDNTVKNRMKMEAILNGKVLTPELILKIEQKAESEIPKVGRKVEHGKDFFDFEYKIRINPVGESFDLAKQNDVMSNALQISMQNPAIVNTPMFRQYLENNGVEWWKLTPDQMKQIQQTATGYQAKLKQPATDQVTEAAMANA